IALGLNVTPLVDRQVKLGKTIKKVLERDETGAPRKWVELRVEEVPQTPVGAVWPQPVDVAGPTPAPAATWPMDALTPFAACQPACPLIPPAVFQCVGAQPPDEVNQAWRIRSVALEGQTRLIIRHGDQDSVTVKTLEIRVPGNDCLTLSPAGEQVCA